MKGAIDIARMTKADGNLKHPPGYFGTPRSCTLVVGQLEVMGVFGEGFRFSIPMKFTFLGLKALESMTGIARTN
ncbi:hypothetical protein [Leptothermofonsia sp. ETS-13]|uniref:hypothetical protein n=1 Tax=Leptothermofonsia sp. ETS-13 TaxID=3035696 RepID=UPI003BA14726